MPAAGRADRKWMRSEDVENVGSRDEVTSCPVPEKGAGADRFGFSVLRDEDELPNAGEDVTASDANAIVDELIGVHELLPNGSRLSCGRLARRRKGEGRQSVPARAQHSGSLKAITARQLQALVRPRPSHTRSNNIA